MRNRFCLLAVLALLLPGCSSTSGGGAAATNGPPEPYTRIATPDTNTLQLQIAVRKFVPANRRGPVIWLAGTTHIGEPEYYQALQKHLNAQTLVLFEGVNAGAHLRRFARPGEPAPRPVPAEPLSPAHSGDGYSMQGELAKSLGLVFQLDAIDYDPTNFYNSDLSVFQIQHLMLKSTNDTPAEPGEPGKSDPSFDALLQIMDGSSLLGSIVKMGIQFIGASPQLQATAKFTLIETIGRLKGDMASMRGMPPDFQELITILIAARNQAVVDDLKVATKQVPRSGSISVFYGTGHMDDMETRLIRQLDYRPESSLWLTAFSVDLRRTGMSPGQIEFMRKLVQFQLDQMQGVEEKPVR